MTFLNPALLLGLIASLIPILIHLFNKRKLEKIEFSSLAFLKELQKTKIKKIKLKQWILLILRTLIIILLVAAFARPAMRSVNSVGISSSAKSTGVFVIDDSPSMRIIGNEGSYFSKGVGLVGKILDQYQDGDEIKIMLLSEPENVYSFSNRFAAVKFLGKLRTHDYSGLAGVSLSKAFALAAESRNINKEIFFISDLQKNDLNLSEKLSGIEKKTGGINFYLVDIDKNEIINRSLNKIKIENQIYELGKEIGLSLYGSTNVLNSEGVLSVFVNGVRTAQGRMKFSGGNTAVQNISITLKEAGALEIKAELEEDAFKYDNPLYASIRVPDKLKIGLVFSNSGDAEFVELALQSQINKTILLKKIQAKRFNSFNLSEFDVIILIGTEDLGNFRKLTRFVESGKGVLYFPSKINEPELYNKFAAFADMPSGAKMIFDSGNLSVNSFDKVDFNHPLFMGLIKDVTKKISSPEIYKYIKFNNALGIRPIVTLADGSPFLSEKISNGKILFINTFPGLSWSNFPLKGLFAPLIYRSLIYLSATLEDKNEYIVGGDISVNLSQLNTPALTVKSPRNKIEKIDLSKNRSKTFVYKNAITPGVYRFFNNDRLIKMAAVNPDPGESVLEYWTSDEFAELLKKGSNKLNVVIIEEGDDIANVIYQTRFGVELWKYLLIIVLVLALIEMLIARNTKQEIVSLKNVGNA